MVATSADRAGLTYAESLANGCYYALVVMTFMAALGQFEIKVELLNNLILIGCAGMALGFGLAFGIGGREVVGGILSRLGFDDLDLLGDLAHVPCQAERVTAARLVLVRDGDDALRPAQRLGVFGPPLADTAGIAGCDRARRL